ncbi:PKD domain-containing protein [Nonomuraea sp. NPDC004580]|uniref:PKD domain-containing protein n=1 Tax=Nonomuraea sp. NPDC004580 TaxID=3154552 RepID=UPI0033B72191
MIYSISGMGPQAALTGLRVTGRAFNCPSVQVTSSLTAPAAVLVNNDSFDVTVPIPGPVACGQLVDFVKVKCLSGDPAQQCEDEETDFNLECCRITVKFVRGEVAPGSLTPNAVVVTGTAYGCTGDQVEVVTSASSGPPVAAQVDAATGTYIAVVPLSVAITCDQEIDITVACKADPNCPPAKQRVRVDCPQCLRATLTSASSGPCQAGQQPITLSGTVMIPAGHQVNLVWDFGDGSPLSAPFPVDNQAGTSTTPHPVSTTAPHLYSPGTYQAFLRLQPPSECPPVPVTVTATCGTGCPVITATASVGDCVTEPTSPVVNHRPITFEVTSFNPALPATASAYVTWSYGGPDSMGATSASTTITALPHQHTRYFTHQPGGYAATATVTIIDNGQLLCAPPAVVNFALPANAIPPVIPVSPCVPCPIQVNVVQAAPANPPLPASNAGFTASIVWPANIMSPPMPVGFDWVVTLPAAAGQPAPQAKTSTTGNTVDTTAAGHWTGAGATAASAVNLSAGGTYAVGATAKFALSAGVPATCNLTGSAAFPVAGPPPECPTVTALNVTDIGCVSATGTTATSFTASVTNAGAVVGDYEWDFGDPASGTTNTITTVTPAAQHTFSAPGTYNVTLTINKPDGCVPQRQSISAMITVPHCPCPPGQHHDAAGNCVPDTPDPCPPGQHRDLAGNCVPDDDVEVLGCGILRWAAVLLIALGLFVFVIVACVPGLGQALMYVLIGVAIGLILAGIILLLIWAFICPNKPCAWFLLILWQITLAFGVVCLYFTVCCPILLWIGLGAIAGALVLLGLWINACRPTFCRIIAELAPVLANIIAGIGIVAAIPLLNACLNPAIGVIVGGVSAILVGILATCAVPTAGQRGGRG